MQDMVDAWTNISDSSSTFDSCLQILDLIDNDILDGKLTKFTDAVGGMALWMENSIGALDLWHVIGKSLTIPLHRVTPAAATGCFDTQPIALVQMHEELGGQQFP